MLLMAWPANPFDHPGTAVIKVMRLGWIALSAQIADFGPEQDAFSDTVIRVIPCLLFQAVQRGWPMRPAPFAHS
jgi:hypothetical protein